MFGQNVILQETVTNVTEKPKHGPNCRFFNHFYFSFGINPTLQSGETEVFLLSSNRVTLGNRQIFRLNNYIATGFNIELSTSNFKVKQNENNQRLDSMFHEKERYIFKDLSGSWFIRLNFDKRRGKYIGHFMDLGAYGGYNFSRQRFVKDITTENSITKIWYKQPDYLNAFQYGVFVRIGLNRYVIYSGYRLSDLIDTSKGLTQLPAFTFGLEVGFHK